MVPGSLAHPGFLGSSIVISTQICYPKFKAVQLQVDHPQDEAEPPGLSLNNQSYRS